MTRIATAAAFPHTHPGFRWALEPAAVSVGIVDDGVDPSHAAFAGRMDLARSVDHVDGAPPHVGPTSAHGTAVAGVVVRHSRARL